MGQSMELDAVFDADRPWPLTAPALRLVALVALAGLYALTLPILVPYRMGMPGTMLLLFAGGLLFGTVGGVVTGIATGGYLVALSLVLPDVGLSTLPSRLGYGVGLALTGTAIGLLRDLWVRVTLSRSRYQRMTEELADLAATDPLTGIPNRRSGEATLGVEASRLRRSGTPCSVALFDIDRFKRINDEYGHQFGDRTLRAVAGALHNEVRPTDSVARWGGEEFLVVFPHTDLANASLAADRLRVAVHQLPLEHGAVTISGGVTVLQPDERPEDAVKRADSGLYRSKNRGRNTVTAISATGSTVPPADSEPSP